ncbi:MAG: SOS response-associated peptidase [Beijerinckiaceae bacterium]
MCGRYALTLPPEAVRRLFGYSEQPNFPPRYNIAPTQPVAVVVQERGARHFVLMRWGFLPSWVKDPKDFPLVINVRSETAAQKPSFRAAFRRRRVILPADGFYEWHRVGREKRPYLFRRPDRDAFAFAALWETWNSADGSEIDTVAVMTTHANAVMAPIHDRCPVILDGADAIARWMDADADLKDIAPLLKPPRDDFFEAVRVGSAVNTVANDGPALQLPFAEAAQPEAPMQAATSGPPRRLARRAAGSSGQGDLF